MAYFFFRNAILLKLKINQMNSLPQQIQHHVTSNNIMKAQFISHSSRTTEMGSNYNQLQQSIDHIFFLEKEKCSWAANILIKWQQATPKRR
jgi:hypothetical protein